MKYNRLLTLSLLVILVLYISEVFSNDKLGSFHLGWDYLTNNQVTETLFGDYKLSNSGLQIGFGIPLNIPLLDYTYRIGMTFHNIHDRKLGQKSLEGYSETDLCDGHFSAVNELLIGKIIKMPSKLSNLPQLGFGIQVDALYQNDKSIASGVIHNCLFIDISDELRCKFDSFGMGLRINYLFSIRENTIGYKSTNRLQISYLLFK